MAVSSLSKAAIPLLMMLSFALYAQNMSFVKSFDPSKLWSEDIEDMYSSSAATGSPDVRAVNMSEEPDTAIVITSSWIPSHPSTNMIETVVNSTVHLKGLSPSTPIIITIDTFVHGSSILSTKDDAATHSKKLEALEEYANRLFEKYLPNPRIHVLPGMSNLHIGGSTYKAVSLIEKHYPSVKYLYYLQHDFYFVKHVDHRLLVNLMEQYPSRVNYVVFPKRWNVNLECGNETAIVLNHTTIPEDTTTTQLSFGNTTSNNRTTSTPIANENDPRWTEPTLTISPSGKYSDNNHFVRFKWYKETLESLVFLGRPPEFPLQKRAFDTCRENKGIGLWVYDQVVTLHLDGRNTKEY